MSERIPVAERLSYSGCGAVRSVLNWCDGKRDPAEAFRLAEVERNRRFGDEQFQQIVEDMRFLSEAGHVLIG